MLRKTISKTLIFTAMVLAVGYSFKSVVAQDSTSSAAAQSAAAVTASGAPSKDALLTEKQQAYFAQQQEHADEQADIRSKSTTCMTEKTARQKYEHEANDTCPKSSDQKAADQKCEDESKNCVGGYDTRFDKALDAADAKIQPPKTVTDDDLDDAPDPNAKVPQEGDPDYCNPNGEDVGKETKALTKKSSSTSTTDSSASGTPTPTECESASLNDKMNHLDEAYKDDKKLAVEKQNDYLTAVQQSQTDQAKCSADLEAKKSQLATLQGQAAALPSQENRAISGANVPQQAAIQEAELAQAAAQKNVDMIKAKATGIEAQYADALSQALTACYTNLQTMAGNNSLNRGASLNQVLGQAQGGITNNKCQTNFMYQQTQARAWRAYIVQLQENQAEYMQAQAQVDLAYAHIQTVALAGSEKDKDTIQAFAEKHQALDTAITSANSAVTSAGNICMSQSALNQQKEATAMQPAKDAAERARLEYCEEDYLKKNYGGRVTGKKDKETDHLKELEKVKKEWAPDPCASLPCSDPKYGVCSAPTADPCAGSNPPASCTKTPKDGK
jgi:hypothetical protein